MFCCRFVVCLTIMHANHSYFSLPSMSLFTAHSYTSTTTSEPLIAAGNDQKEETLLVRREKCWCLLLGFLVGMFFHISSSAIVFLVRVLQKTWGDDLHPNIIVAAAYACPVIVLGLMWASALVVRRQHTKTCTNRPSCSRHMERFCGAGGVIGVGLAWIMIEMLLPDGILFLGLILLQVMVTLFGCMVAMRSPKETEPCSTTRTAELGSIL